jgi:L-fuconolactonase
MTIVDAHLHVWDLQTASYPWLGPHLAAIDRTVEFDEVAGSLAERGVGQVVLVQASDDAADTAHMLAVADAHPAIAGVVVWVPLDEPEAAARQLSALRADARVVGVRTLQHDRADPDWILRPEVDAGLGMLEAAGVPYDYVTAGPAAIAHLPLLAERHPELSLVLDHLGKPPLGDDAAAFAGWEALVRHAAENPRLTAKVSGLYGPPDRVRAAVDVALDTFGPSRLMYGSDWPVCELAGGLAAGWGTLDAVLAGLDAADRDALLAGTARRIYRLPIPTLDTTTLDTTTDTTEAS